MSGLLKVARFVFPLCFAFLLFSGCSGGNTGSFALAVTPSSLSVQGGASAQVTVSAAFTGSFNTPVGVTLATLPAGVTASPASLTLTSGASQAVFTLTAAGSVAAGSATVAVVATGGTVTQKASVALTVTPQPTFTLSTTQPGSSLIAGGGSVPVTLTVAPVNGFTGTVAVSLSGLPAGVTASPSLANVSSSAPQTIALTAAAGSTPTSATVTATGTSGSLTETASFTVSVVAPAAPTGPDITTYHYDNARDGLNAKETILTPANVNSSSFGLLGNYPVDGKVDAQPLYVGGLPFGAGATLHSDNVVYVATENDTVYALNAANGGQEWKTSVLGSGETPSDARSCNQVAPQIGITSTPVIDRSYGSHGAIFVVAMSKDVSGGYHQRLHGLDLLTGAEVAGSPTDITATYPGTGENSSGGNVIFDPAQYVARAGLLLQNGIIYIGWSSHCDIQPYTGWMMGYSEAGLKQSAVLNLTPNGSEGSIWMSGFGLAADASGNIFFADANGTLDPSFSANGFPSMMDFGNAIVKLSTSNGLVVNDFWEPWNTVAESNADVDLGSGGAMLLPDLTDSSGAVHQLVVVAGKDTNIYVADRNNLGKFAGGNSNSSLYQEIPGALPNGEWAGPAYFNNTVYFGGVGDSLKAYSVANAKLSSTPASQSSATFGYPGATPSVSSNGVQGGIVWALQSSEGAPAVLHAYDAGNLGNEIYNSEQAAKGRDAFGNGNKFVTPVVSNGMVFVGTPSSVAIFGLLPR